VGSIPAAGIQGKQIGEYEGLVAGRGQSGVRSFGLVSPRCNRRFETIISPAGYFNLDTYVNQ
jgi:hypothetical protein